MLGVGKRDSLDTGRSGILQPSDQLNPSRHCKDVILALKAVPRPDFDDLDQRLPRFSCSRSIASNRALKFPLPNPVAPRRSMNSKNTVGRSCSIRLNI